MFLTFAHNIISSRLLKTNSIKLSSLAMLWVGLCYYIDYVTVNLFYVSQAR